jgi:drug/metabolite transporter (DMT)-like permease
LRLAALTALAMVAFAANSLLCRAALRDTAIDAATFTTVRLAAGALLLAVLARGGRGGSWAAAVALFAYAAAFSFAYVRLSTGTGALLLFAAVQGTMVGRGLLAGERIGAGQTAGLVLALAGLVALLLPGLTAPPIGAALLMLLAGVAWGDYSLRGRGATNPLGATARNFLRALPFALVSSAATWRGASWDARGLLYAALSGAVASGVGYALWYAALPAMRATTAATVQLSVPVIAAAAGVLLLGEPLTLRLAVASAAILGGIALVLRKRGGARP